MQSIDLQNRLPLVASGKVRELFELPNDKLLFVATDRISAYDVVMSNGIPHKGEILTNLSRFWFKLLENEVINHLADNGDPLGSLPKELVQDPKIAEQLKGRCMVVNKLRILPLEVIVRGYITGSAWSEYTKHGTVHGVAQPAGLQESQQFPEPIFTPSTKAGAGEHDMNINKAEAAKILGDEQLLLKVEQVAISLYKKANEYASKHGIIIADTKFEFGLDSQNNLVLVDEVLTPDSSRFWPAATYKVGQGQDSFDKQYLRNWLVDNNLKGKPDVTIPEEVVKNTQTKYLEVQNMLIQ